MRSRKLFASLTTGSAVVSLMALAAPSAIQAADNAPLLRGHIASPDGGPLAGIPVKAHLANSNMTVAVYTDKSGDFDFPAWSDLKPGSWTVAVELPDFEHVSRAETLSSGKTARVNFTVKSKPLAYEDATASEIIAALPGTDQQKVLFSQCSNCHTLQWALQIPRSKEQWVKVIRMMAGRAADDDTPGTYAFSQKQFIEPLAEYLASIRGPGSSDKIPFKQRPRPTDAASTSIVVTEYDLPRGGQRDLFMLRGDPAYVWPHDVIMNDQYAYYTDHFSYTMGRLDRKTGEVKEMQFEGPPGAGRDPNGGDGRPGNPGGGTHELQFDPQGNVIIGMRKGTVRYNPQTNRFNGWAAGSDQFGLDPQGNTWTLAGNGQLMKLDTSTEALKRTIYPIPKNAGIYDIDTDSKGRTDLYIWREGKIGIFDPASIEYKDYPTPTPMSGPRRGQIDAQNRLWAAEFYAGQVLMFDPDKQQLKEFSLIEGVKPYTAPYAEPYSASVDDKNHVVWTNDFSSSRIYKIDTATGKSIEYMTPSNYEIRDFKVEVNAPRPTVWIPAYRPPSKLVKVQVR